MNCQRCNSTRVASIKAKCGDRCFTCIGDGYDYIDFPPTDIGIGGGDYVDFEYCLDCGQMQGEFPIPQCTLEVKDKE